MAIPVATRTTATPKIASIPICIQLNGVTHFPFWQICPVEQSLSIVHDGVDGAETVKLKVSSTVDINVQLQRLIHNFDWAYQNSEYPSFFHLVDFQIH